MWTDFRGWVAANTRKFHVYNFVFWVALWPLTARMVHPDNSMAWLNANGYLAAVFFGLATLVSTIILPSAAGMRELRALLGQRNRVSVLRKFEPEKLLFTGASVFTAVMDLLDRADEAPKSKHDPVEVLLLLCTPALDYPRKESKGSSYVQWGEEFGAKVDKFLNDSRVHIELSCLSGAPQGPSPRDDFLQTLAAYCAAFEGREGIAARTRAAAIHVDLKEADRTGYDLWEAAKNKRLNTSIRHPRRIPFQIVLAWSSTCRGVVVTFAGTEILEAGTAGDPMGLASSDPVVVAAFKEVYQDYVVQTHRRSVAPAHTQKIIEAHKQADSSGSVDNYLNLGLSIEVAKEMFSPFIANSSKFTCDVLKRFMPPNATRVLDIGAGSGVLSLVAGKLMKENNRTGTVVALEPHRISHACLERNIASNAKQTALVTAYPAALMVKRTGISLQQRGEGWDYANKLASKQREGQFVQVDKDQKGTGVLSDMDDQTFDVIIADLPFANAEPSPADFWENSFFDLEHREHHLFLHTVAGSGWLRRDGLLITAFSTLGGVDDVADFEDMVKAAQLKILHKSEYAEDGFMWIAYVLVHKAFDTEYWWSTLNARPPIVRLP